MPKIQQIGRNLGILIDKNIALGFKLKKGDRFILAPVPESSDINIQLCKPPISTKVYHENIKQNSRIKDGIKFRSSLLITRIKSTKWPTEYETKEYLAKGFLPQEIDDLKLILKKYKLDNENKKKIEEIICINEDAILLHTKLTKREKKN